MTGIVGSMTASTRCSSSQAVQAACQLSPPRLRGDVLLPRQGAPLSLLDPLTERRSVELAPVVEAPVVGEHLRCQDVEEVVACLRYSVGRRRLDEHRTEATARVERVLEPGRHVGVEVGSGEARRNG